MDSASDKKSWWEEWKVLVYWAGIVLIMWLIMWLSLWLIYYDSSSKESKWGEAGTFGDMFGALSCLFSGFAFAGLIVTIRQQNHDLKLQREELRNTVAEAKAQTKLMDEQVKSQKAQLEMQKEQNEEQIFYMREQHTEIHTQRLTQEDQNQKAQSIDEFYRNLSHIISLEANIKIIEKRNDSNGNAYIITYSGMQATKMFRDSIYYGIKNCRDKGNKIALHEALYDEAIMSWVLSIDTFAADIYTRLFPEDEPGVYQTAQCYARVLMNTLSDSEKDLLYFISRSMLPSFLKGGVDRLIELNVLREDLITSCFKEAEVQEAYRITAIPEKYRTQYTPPSS